MLYAMRFPHCLATLFAAQIALLSSAGCRFERGGPGTEEPVDLPAEDPMYMVKTFKDNDQLKRLGFVPVDLTDEMQYNYVVGRLLRSGNTPETAPQLFKRLEAMREPAASSSGDMPNQTTAVPSLWCGQFITPEMQTVLVQADPAGEGTGPVSVTQADAKVLVTCFGGADYVFTDLTAYETDAEGTYFNELAHDYAEEFAGGTSFSAVGTHTEIPNDLGKHHLLESLAVAFDEATGKTSVTFTQFGLEANGQPPRIEIAHPKEWNDGYPIRSCIKRTALELNDDCDYASVTWDGALWNGDMATPPLGIAKVKVGKEWWGADKSEGNSWYPPDFSPENLYLPFAGTFHVGKIMKDEQEVDCEIIGYDEAATKVIMTLKDGGWCSPVVSDGHSTDIYKSISTSSDFMTANFNALSNFGQDCLGDLEDVDVRLEIHARAKCGDMTKPRIALVNNKHIGGAIDFRNGCLAAGTGVMLEDGRYVPIESIKKGNKVIADASGLRLTVTGVTRGGELKPLVRLHDSEGHDVLLTTNHPVSTPGGVVPADTLEEGATVETESGVAALTSVERVRYDGPVYNLSLGTAEELGDKSVWSRTMIAGGIRVGDNEAQRELEIARRRPKRELHEAWAADYERDQARGGKAHVAQSR